VFVNLLLLARKKGVSFLSVSFGFHVQAFDTAPTFCMLPVKGT
jgi:hypothetical protein